MLRYKADLRTLAFVATFFVLVAVQWIYAPTTWWIAIPLFLATCSFAFLGAVATHNTVHTPVFHQRWANRVFQCVLTLTYGHPVSAYVPGHNMSHHKHTQTQRDIMRTTKARWGWNLMNLFFFAASVGPSITAADSRFMKAMYRRNPAWFRQCILEWSVRIGSAVILLALDWKKYLLYVQIPYFYAAWGIITMNLLQHDGCDENSEYNHSRNFTGKIINWFAYNNGYHTIHHMHAGLHWSLAPEAHAREVKPFIHPALDQPSFLAYLWRTYFWPGKRERFDGTPLNLPEAGEDQEWIPSPKEMPEDVSLGAVTS